MRQDVANPNDMINTDDGRYVFGTWSAKAHGTYQAPWNLLITPALRLQAGQPYGRTIQVTLNYGAQRILTEPISHAAAGQHRPARHAGREGDQGGRRPVGLVVRGRLQPDERERRVEHQLGLGLDVPAAGDDRLAAPRHAFGAKFEW